MSGQARAALDRTEVVLGYKTYIDQVRPWLGDREILASGMTKEIDRASQALDLALAGRRVALVSGGDPGIYAMAGVVFEVARGRGLALGDGPGAVRVEIIPGIPALAAAGALLGAPLTHDFACVSLSDRLTPWDLIARRLELASQADFVIVLYNPKSRGRDWQFGEALKIIGRVRGSETPVGVATKAMRAGQSVRLTTLGQAAEAPVDMQTIVIIGNSQSFQYQGFMVTPRGYLDKYGLEGE
ncbi:MAG: precorrin-3B C(17)-methyltransferase [Pseudomonadota bacterium]